ncbi:MAG: ROK family protein [Pseudonocardiaceae bacterium]|nr:ROK family protein [Pseudonocardiaceae bacterium]
MNTPTLALDVGGTKLAAALVDTAGRVLRSTRRRTPAVGVWDEVSAMLRDVRGSAPIRGIGISCVGPIDLMAGTVSPVNITEWMRFPLRDRVAALVGDLPVALANDGVCMALGEQRHGARGGSPYLFGVVVSTGVGGGLVAGGRPVLGRSGNAGHVGHVVVEPGGDPCGCGGRGCLETVTSGPHLVRWARQRGWAGDDAAALATSARAGDAVARRAFRRGGLALGRALASVAAVCDVDLIVLGGGVAEAAELLLDPTREALAEHARLEFLRSARVVPASLGSAGGLVGAAALLDA